MTIILFISCLITFASFFLFMVPIDNYTNFFHIIFTSYAEISALFILQLFVMLIVLFIFVGQSLEDETTLILCLTFQFLLSITLGILGFIIYSKLNKPSSIGIYSGLQLLAALGYATVWSIDIFGEETVSD